MDLVFSTQNNVPLIYNPAQVKVEEVDELYKVLDPKWKGKIAVQDPIPSGTGNGVFVGFGVCSALRSEGFLPETPRSSRRHRQDQDARSSGSLKASTR